VRNRQNSLVTANLTQRQFDALVSIVYNVGRDRFATSELRADLNVGNYSGAASQMLRWEFVKVRDGYVFSGVLANRRVDEMSLFSGVPWGP
jgi:lysozyme